VSVRMVSPEIPLTLTLTAEELRVTVRAWLMAATMLEALEDEDAPTVRALADWYTPGGDDE
jgi:hypothetical protein